MDDLKLFFKSEEQIDTLVRTDHVFSTDIGIEFVIKKCGILTMKRRKVVRCEGAPKYWSNERGQNGRIHIFGHEKNKGL